MRRNQHSQSQLQIEQSDEDITTSSPVRFNLYYTTPPVIKDYCFVNIIFRIQGNSYVQYFDISWKSGEIFIAMGYEETKGYL